MSDEFMNGIIIPTDLMVENMRKEEFSISFLRALTSVAGYSTSKPEVDDDSIDISIRSKSKSYKWKSPQVDVQLKCTSDDLGNDEDFPFSVKLKNYDDLRIDAIIPRILVILQVPKSIDGWIIHSNDRLCLHNGAYWYSLQGEPESQNSTSVTIRIPKANRLTIDRLHWIMDCVGNGKNFR